MIQTIEPYGSEHDALRGDGGSPVFAALRSGSVRALRRADGTLAAWGAWLLAPDHPLLCAAAASAWAGLLIEDVMETEARQKGWPRIYLIAATEKMRRIMPRLPGWCEAPQSSLENCYVRELPPMTRTELLTLLARYINQEGPRPAHPRRLLALAEEKKGAAR